MFSFERFRKKDVYKPLDVHISLYEGHLTEGFKQKHPLVSVVAQRWYTAPGVQRVDVREKELKGTLFIPPGISGRQYMLNIDLYFLYSASNTVTEWFFA